MGITYEWKPNICGICKMIGHHDIECRMGTRRVSVQKKQPVVQAVVHTPEVDQESF